MPRTHTNDVDDWSRSLTTPVAFLLTLLALFAIAPASSGRAGQAR